MYKFAVRYDANGEIHLMISFRHGFHGKRIKKIRAFRVVPVSYTHLTLPTN